MQDVATLTDPQQIRVEMIKLRLVRKRRIDQEKGCWIWTGHHVRGLGLIKLGKTRVPVHRLAIALWKGIVLKPNECAVLTCGTDGCFHPEHREIVSKGEVRRRAARNSLKQNRETEHSGGANGLIGGNGGDRESRGGTNSGNEPTKT